MEKNILRDQFEYFPGTRYMGSKNKIIYDIWEILKDLEFNSFYDAFSGSNIVGYFLKCQGKKVITNDFMSMSYHVSKAIIENNNTKLNDNDIDKILNRESKNSFISTKFKNLYFSDIDNSFLDKARENIDFLNNEFKRSIALASLTRACLKKRPRGIFTYVGERYNDGRRDLKYTLEEHFIENINLYNNAVFDNLKINKSYNLKTEDFTVESDLVYFDPPYFSPKSDNDYVRRYHFVEGLVKNWEGLDIQEHTQTKKFKSYKSPFSNKKEAYIEFEKLFEKFKNSIIAVSYSSNSLPSKDEMVEILKTYKTEVNVFEIDHTYSFGTHSHKKGNSSNKVKEYLFIAK